MAHRPLLFCNIDHAVGSKICLGTSLKAVKNPPESYAGAILVAAGVYNLVWGAAVVLFPLAAFEWLGIDPPRYPSIWQCVGMIVGVYGVGYLIAATNPSRHWAIVLVGLLGKVLGPIGFLHAASSGALPWEWGIIIVLNDLVWWIPFAHILYLAAERNSDTSVAQPYELDDAMDLIPSQLGLTLTELANDRPVMVVLLRHFGCTFCRQALSDLSRLRDDIEALGYRIALVHMSPIEEADEVLARYGLSDLHSFSDVECEFYRAFGLKRGTALQLFGPRLWRRAIAATLEGNVLGKLAGDGFRMPGVFFVYRGDIWGAYRHQTAADRPEYLQLAQGVQTILQNETAAS